MQQSLIEREENSQVKNLYGNRILNTLPEPFLDTILKTVVKVFNCSLSRISFFDEETVLYREVVVNNPTNPTIKNVAIPSEKNPCAFVLQNQVLTILDRYPSNDDPLWESYDFQVSNFGLLFYAGIPLKTSDEITIGVLSILDEQPRLFTDRDKDLLISMAQLAIEELELRTSLQAATDKQQRLIEAWGEQNQELEFNKKLIKEKNDLISILNKNLQSTNERLEDAKHQLTGKINQKSKKMLMALKSLVLSQKELETLVYNSSHGLKSPISSLQGLSALAKIEISDKVGLDYFEKIEKIAGRMQSNLRKVSMIHDLFNEKNVGMIRHLDKTDFKWMIDKTVESFSKEINEAKLMIEVNISPNVYFAGSDLYLQYIIENIIENSIFFTGSKKSITAQLPFIIIQVDQYADELFLDFYDNGEGIPKNMHAKIFDMFFRASNKAGAGLGLYIVKKSVEKMNGTVKVESKFGEYTRFLISIPNFNLKKR